MFDSPNFTDHGVVEEDLKTGAWKAKVKDIDYRFPSLVTPEWAALCYKKWGPTSAIYIAKVLGRFPKSSPDAVIPLEWILAAQARSLPASGATRISVDVAGDGNDRSVISKAVGPVFRVLKEFHNIRTTALVGEVKKQVLEHIAEEIRIDPIGIGAGPFHQLEDWDYNITVYGVHVGESAIEEEDFTNHRSECWWKLRERFENGDIDIDPEDDDLAAELGSITYGLDGRGRIAVTPKKRMVKKGFTSPDRADTLMMAYAPVKAVPATQVFV